VLGVTKVGNSDGAALLPCLGDSLGELLGVVSGDTVPGVTDGTLLGAFTLEALGCALRVVDVGTIVGGVDVRSVGPLVGSVDGTILGGSLGKVDGRTDGVSDGKLVGVEDGSLVGEAEGKVVGKGVG
jgi:hypothetical protein